MLAARGLLEAGRMLGRRLKSALFIDFENVQLDPVGLANVLAWLEDGAFDETARRRKLLVKTIYWNATAERNRARYEALGFEVVLCDKYANLKNGADIRMAMDMAEARLRQPNIQEFILLSKDSDFVPVLQRLHLRKRRTVVLVDESKPAIYTVYAKAADITVPVRRLMGEGRTYVRPQRGLLERLGVSKRRAAPVPSSGAAATSAAAAPATPKSTVAARHPGFAQAIEKVVGVATRNSGQPTGRQAITRELQSVPGFASNGADRYFGYGSYEALMRAIVAADSRVAIRSEKGGGMSLVAAAAHMGTPRASQPTPPGQSMRA